MKFRVTDEATFEIQFEASSAEEFISSVRQVWDEWIREKATGWGSDCTPGLAHRVCIAKIDRWLEERRCRDDWDKHGEEWKRQAQHQRAKADKTFGKNRSRSPLRVHVEAPDGTWLTMGPSGAIGKAPKVERSIPEDRAEELMSWARAALEHHRRIGTLAGWAAEKTEGDEEPSLKVIEGER